MEIGQAFSYANIATWGSRASRMRRGRGKEDGEALESVVGHWTHLECRNATVGGVERRR